MTLESPTTCAGAVRSSDLVRPIAVLCVSPQSVYKRIGGVDAYDMARDARTFVGGMPVVAHPPCRAWSAKCAHQAKPLPGEKELGLWCAQTLRDCGGVLEQPAHSRLFAAAGLPSPDERASGMLWSAEVLQLWWGYCIPKITWLCFSRIPRRAVQFPIKLQIQQPARDRRKWESMSKHQRSATTEQFARWLVAAARTVGPNHNSTTPVA